MPAAEAPAPLTVLRRQVIYPAGLGLTSHPPPAHTPLGLATLGPLRRVCCLGARILGGEIRFEQRVVDVHIDTTGPERRLQGLQVLNQTTGETYHLPTPHAVMALGHSARDTFTMF